MKILDAWISDPLMEGVLGQPELCVDVDSLPDVTIEPESYSHNDEAWSVGKFGPFVRYEYVKVSPNGYNSSGLLSQGQIAGKYNATFTGIFPPSVDIILVCDSAEHTEYALPLNRARQLLKKYSPEWRLLLADKDAMEGRFLWLPVESDPPCKSFIPATRSICGDRPARQTVRINNVEVPMCPKHIQEHNKKQANRRVTSSSK